MIFDAAALSLRNLFAPETRNVFWKTLGLTILVLIGLWFGLRESFIAFVMPMIQGFIPELPDWAGWLTFIFGILASIGLALGLALLLSPVAEVVEKRDYPNDPPGKAMPMGEAVIASIKFFGVVIVGNLFALMLLFIPGINIIAFFLVNGYLLGREFFEFAAMRFRSAEEAKLLRSQHSGTVFMAGLVIALFLAVPIVNLLTPLFAAGLMVHLHKALTGRAVAASLRQR
jgi:CysZ protein